MKYFTLIVALLASASLVPSDAYNKRPLSDADVMRLTTIIAAEDNPQLLSDSLDPCQVFIYDDNITTILHRMIEHNRFKSFISFYPRIDLRSAYVWWANLVFNRAAQAHRFEICDFLLYQEFPLGDGWYDSLQNWDLNQFKRLIDNHQDRLVELAPSKYYLSFGRDAEGILAKLEILEYCRSIDQTFAENSEYQPYKLFEMVAHNSNLGDAEMTKVIAKTLSMGPALTPAMVEKFQIDYPNFEQSNQLLSDYMENFIKEPGMD
jgi:hypothetical protein